MPLTASLNHTFAHSWSEISLAYWLKYPSPERPDVLSVDLIDREFDPETGILSAKRIITSRLPFPAWLHTVVPWDLTVDCHGLEAAKIDPRRQIMHLSAQNLTFGSVMRLTERCIYQADPSNPAASTLLLQEAETESDLFWAVAKSVESWTLQTFKEKAVLGRRIMEETSNRIREELASTGRVHHS
jgi:hypothetical protein